MTKTLVPLLSILVFLFGCGSERAAEAPLDSGIRGLVLLGPNCPVFQEGVPCPDGAHDGEVRVLRSGSDDVVATVQSGKDGRFVVRLPPGRYVLAPVSPEGGLPFGKPVDVVVRAHAFTLVRVRFDTGIR
jgi:hypothetical protein